MAEATEVIRDCLLEYGSDVLKTKFPSFVDGLKDVTRRIIWFSKDEKDVASFLEMMGKIVAQHVGGDSSVYGAIIRLGQPFMIDHPLITIQGKSGAYYDPKKSGQPRYLKMGLSDFGRDLFFNGIHPKTIPMQPTKDFTTVEPIYLIPKLPMALLLGNLTVGFGFKSTIPMYDFCNICDMVMCFSEWFSNGNFDSTPPSNILAKWLVPIFPIPNIIKNKTELISMYSKNQYNYPSEIEGWCDISGNNITLRALPYGVDFGTITNLIRNITKDKKHWINNYITSANQFSTNEAEFSMDIKRGVNPYEVLDKIRSTLRYNLSWKPIFSYMKNNKAITLPPPLLTYFWYQERITSIAGGLKYKQTELINKRMLLDAIRHIAKHVDKVINIIRNADTEEDAIDILSGKFEDLTLRQCKLIVQQRLSTLTKASKRNIDIDIEQIDGELSSTLDKFDHLHETIYNDAEILKKKYGKPRITKYTEETIGFVLRKGIGATRFFNNEEMYNILNTKNWPANTERIIVPYKEKKHILFIKNNRIYTNNINSRDITCDYILTSDKTFNKNAIIIRADGKLGLYPKGINNSTDFTNMINMCVVEDKFRLITKNGSICDTTFSDLTQVYGNKNKTDVIYAYNKEGVLVYMNALDPNVVNICKINNTTNKIKTLAVGITSIIAYIDLSVKNTWIHIPHTCTKNCIIDNIYITNLHKLLSNQDTISFSIAKPNYNKSITLRKNNDCRTLMHLEV